MVIKVHTTLSGRRAAAEIQALSDAGLLTGGVPCFNSVFRYFDMPEMTALLKMLIEESAAPLSCMEARFVAASSGFQRAHGSLLRAHALVGPITKVVTAARVTDSCEGTSNEAAISETVGYLPYIPFKENSKREGPAVWRRLWGLFMVHPDPAYADIDLHS